MRNRRKIFFNMDKKRDCVLNWNLVKYFLSTLTDTVGSRCPHYLFRGYVKIPFRCGAAPQQGLIIFTWILAVCYLCALSWNICWANWRDVNPVLGLDWTKTSKVTFYCHVCVLRSIFSSRISSSDFYTERYILCCGTFPNLRAFKAKPQFKDINIISAELHTNTS